MFILLLGGVLKGFGIWTRFINVESDVKTIKRTSGFLRSGVGTLVSALSSNNVIREDQMNRITDLMEGRVVPTTNPISEEDANALNRYMDWINDKQIKNFTHQNSQEFLRLARLYQKEAGIHGKTKLANQLMLWASFIDGKTHQRQDA